MKRATSRGFTVLELMLVVAIAILITSVSIIVIPNVLNTTAVDGGYALTLSALRQARQLSIDQMESVQVTFSSGSIPPTITTQNQMPGTGGSAGSGTYFTVGGAASTTYNGTVYANLSSTVKLPSRVRFTLPSSVSVAPEVIPAGQWSAPNSGVPISFTPTTSTTGNVLGYTVTFQPDGTAVCGTGSGTAQCNGIVYLQDMQGNVANLRAITLFGATGRIQGYRYSPKSGGSWAVY